MKNQKKKCRGKEAWRKMRICVEDWGLQWFQLENKTGDNIKHLLIHRYIFRVWYNAR